MRGTITSTALWPGSIFCRAECHYIARGSVRRTAVCELRNSSRMSCPSSSCLSQEQLRKDSVGSESRRYSDKVRDMCVLAERLGCSYPQLAIAWSLKNESCQCLLLGATTTEQLYESLQSLQMTIARPPRQSWGFVRRQPRASCRRASSRSSTPRRTPRRPATLSRTSPRTARRCPSARSNDKRCPPRNQGRACSDAFFCFVTRIIYMQKRAQATQGYIILQIISIKNFTRITTYLKDLPKLT
ncbi:unnamed protein product [Trichogramma brassicae]|uniref:Uncharacterized protein n=1 Tax=Trichogramma brassicae TaxID=86971 RepID=A0A6H5I3R0_9HYME|nr:unnamed protein product [Trichogramma brassicae]